LSALRKLARIAALDYTAPARRAAYKSLLLLRASQEGVRDTIRQHRALTPGQTTRVLDTWDKSSLIHTRNRALVALLFLTGIRRAEAAALRWDDIDLDEALIQIRHGKGDKPRIVVIAGQESVQTLRAWRHAQGAARAYVFCRIGKGDRLGPDTSITDQAVYDVVKRTERRSGITFSPHDARRTFITEALSNGAPLTDVQARRSRLKLRYG
jgi:integrase